MKTIDVTGLSCPEPVVRTQAALKKLLAGESLEVLVDTATARDNVARAAQAAGYRAATEKRGETFRLVLDKTA